MLKVNKVCFVNWIYWIQTLFKESEISSSSWLTKPLIKGFLNFWFLLFSNMLLNLDSNILAIQKHFHLRSTEVLQGKTKNLLFRLFIESYFIILHFYFIRSIVESFFIRWDKCSRVATVFLILSDVISLVANSINIKQMIVCTFVEILKYLLDLNFNIYC